MKKLLSLSIISASLLIAESPIHDKMDSRIKGQSFSGTLDDNVAAQDGLGVLPLQHHTGTTDMNNELLVQKVFNRIVKSETDKTKTVNIRNSMSLGTVGTASDISLLNNAGTTLSYVPGSLSSCKDILTAYPTTPSGIYNLKNLGDHFCDMTTNGGGWTLVGTIMDSTTHGSYAATDSNDKWLNQWNTTSTFGTAATAGTADYKGAAFSQLPASNFMIYQSFGTIADMKNFSTSANAIVYTTSNILNSYGNHSFGGIFTSDAQISPAVSFLKSSAATVRSYFNTSSYGEMTPNNTVTFNKRNCENYRFAIGFNLGNQITGCNVEHVMATYQVNNYSEKDYSEPNWSSSWGIHGVSFIQLGFFVK